MSSQLRGKVALVTGASAGIGAALSRRLVREGMKVAVCARNMDKLQALKAQLDAEGCDGEMFPIKCDLQDTKAIADMFCKIHAKYGKLHVCVNNAGLGHDAPLLSGETAKWEEMFRVNVLALAVCTREAIKVMRDGSVPDGHVIHISSMSGHRIETPPQGHFYAATKHAVKAMTEGLRRELREQNSDIRVTSISPGNVETEFGARMFADSPQKPTDSEFKELESEDIVNSVMHALTAPKHCLIQDILIRPLGQME